MKHKYKKIQYLCFLAIFLGGFFVWPNFVQAVAGDVVINEIAWMGTTELANAEWVELYNTTSGDIDLSEWSLCEAGGETPIISLSKIISAHGYFLIKRTTPSVTYPVVGINEITGSFGGSGLSNSGEYLVLKDNFGLIIDRANQETGEWFAGKGSPNYQTMERKNSLEPGNSSNNWQTSTTAGGTPGAVNSSAAAEPPPPSAPTPPPATPRAPTSSTPAPASAPATPATAATAIIKINEVYPNPQKDDEQEFIELCNKGNTSTTLSGWKLADTKKVINLPEIILVSKECRAFDAKATKITLNNSNETIYLYNPSGEVADKLAYASSIKGQSLSWDETQNKFLWSAKPTPDRNNEISKINEPPQARITFNYNPAAPNEEIIISAEESTDPDDDALLFSWSIGEKFQAAGESLTYRFNSLGAHLIKLTASDGAHAVSATSSISILPAEEILSRRSQLNVGTKVPTPDKTKVPAPTSEKVSTSTPVTAKKQNTSSSKTKTSKQASATSTNDIIYTGDDLVDIDLDNIRELELGSFVRVQGTVAVEPGVLAKTYFYLTGSPGVQVYFSKKDWPALALGDVVGVLGELTETGGELRLKVAAKQDIVPIYKGKPPEPTEAETGEIGEEIEGALVKVSGELTEKKGTSWMIDDGSGEAKITFQTTAKIKKPTIKAGEWVEIIGLVSETKTGYRVLPRYSSDVRVLEEKEAADKTGTVLGETATSNDALARFRVPGNNKPQVILKYLLITSIALIILLAGLLIKFRLETKKRQMEIKK